MGSVTINRKNPTAKKAAAPTWGATSSRNRFFEERDSSAIGWWLIKLGHAQSATIPAAAATANGARSSGSGTRKPGAVSTGPAPAVTSSVMVALPPQTWSQPEFLAQI